MMPGRQINVPLGFGLAGLILMLGVPSMRPVSADDNIKQPNVAGSFYPGDAAGLSKAVETFLAQAGQLKTSGAIGVIISPHAGYVYSGGVAAYGFRAAAGQAIKTVVVLSPSHYFPFRGVAIWPDGAFRTPLGDVKVDEELAGRLLSQDKRFHADRAVFEQEHGVETQLPFIQKVFPGAMIVPVIFGQPDLSVAEAFGQALAVAAIHRQDVLVDVSSDQSHFHVDQEARTIDRRGLDAIEAMDVEKFWNGHVSGQMEVDAFHAITAAMIYAQQSGYTSAKVLKYATSADATGDRSRVVGYASVAFTHPADGASAAPAVKEESAGIAPLTAAQKERLLAIARSTLDEFVRTGRVPGVTEADPRLQQEEGAFVTLTRNGQLRGCIGNIIGQGPLYRTVHDMAIAAASEDPRFQPVKPEELKDISVEVSVLSKPRVASGADAIVMGRHGVIVSRGYQRGVFLPQVATETGWSKEMFLSELCSQKAGLPRDCWQDPTTKLEIFTAEVFGEHETGK
ncbi:MAG: AmmeMemoRadiSam system protein B [Candidatus Omnitrophica bacterium]|nr:AmmeMemoRadiSam system protein B [Candidatus Omnitrophota bacterium]